MKMKSNKKRIYGLQDLKPVSMNTLYVRFKEKDPKGFKKNHDQRWAVAKLVHYYRSNKHFGIPIVEADLKKAHIQQEVKNEELFKRFISFIRPGENKRTILKEFKKRKAIISAKLATL